MASTLLKGAGQHRLVAFTYTITAIVNVSLSIALVRPLGLLGVAIGTSVPVTAAAVFVIFPTGCRRVGLTLGRGIAEAVWPAVWPAAAMIAYVALTHDFIPYNIFAVGAEMLAAALVYAATFLLFGISAAERRFYMSKVSQLTLGWLPAPSMSEGA